MEIDKVDYETKLIKLVQERPVLYAKTSVGFKDRRLKYIAWESIAKELNSTVQACMEEWGKLRTQYTDYLRKINKPQGPDGKPNPRFRHSERMAFYMKHYNPNTKTLLRTQSMSAHVEPDVIIEAESLPLMPTMDVTLLEDSCDTITMRSESVESEESKRCMKPSEMTMNVDSTEKKYLTVYKNKYKEDEFDFFCSSLAPKIRRLHERNPIAAEQLQIKILESVLEAHKDVL